MTVSSLRAIFVLSIATLAPPLLTAQNSAASSPNVAKPPQVLQRATLSNGFEYVIAPNALGSGRISLRLVVHVGSLDEHDNERGYAHFVEHMAFNGTTHFAPGKLVPFFERLGLAYGPDTNAETSFAHTVYRLDFPSTQSAHLTEGFQAMRDFADGIAFGPAEVQRERGVILSEISARNNDDYQTEQQRLRFLYAGTAVPDRFPLGDSALIKAAQPETLRAFYSRTYSANRMTLLIAGDVDPAAVSELVEKTFSSMRGSSSTSPARAPINPRSDGFRVHVMQSAKEPAASIAIMTALPLRQDTQEARDANLGDMMVIQILNRHLIERRAAAADQFGNANAFHQWGPDGALMHFGAEVHTAATNWASGVEFLETEFRRARTNGFSVAELNEAAAWLIAGWRTEVNASEKELPVQLANRLVGSLFVGSLSISPTQRLDEATRFVERFSPALAAEAFARIFPPDRQHLILKKGSGASVTEEILLSAFQKSAATPLTSELARETAELRFAYGPATVAGVVTHHRSIADLGIELVNFANGVKFNLRPSVTEPRHFRLLARCGRGIADLPRDKPGLGNLAMSFLGETDLNRHTRQELGRLIRVRGVSAETNFQNGQLTVSLEGPTSELAFALQFLTAFLSDQKLDPTRLPQAVSFYVAGSAELFGSSASYTNAESIFQMAGADSRLRFPSAEDVAAYPSDAVTSWIKSRWLEGALEVGVTGDCDIAATIDAAATSIGALAQRADSSVSAADGFTLLAKPIRTLTGRVLPDQAATVRLTWPAKDAADARIFRALQLASMGLAEHFRTTLRQEIGATYSPNVATSRENAQPNFAFVAADVTCEPAKAQDMAERMMKIADAYSRRGMTKEEFARLREPLIASAAENLRNNEWWLNAVVGLAQTVPGVLDDARAHANAYASLTREEVNRVLAAHLGKAHANVFGIIPEVAKPAPAAAKK